MKKYLLLMMCLALALVPLTAEGQNSADKLFQQGQRFQMKQTVASQNKAIAKFNAAKKAYDSQEKKTMCDNQIQICRNNINTIENKDKQRRQYYNNRNNADRREGAHTTKAETEVEEKKEEPAEEKAPVELSLSKSSLEFKGDGNKDDNHQVTVNCNYTTWTYTAPDWVSITKNGNILTLTASPNDTGKERSGKVVVECDGTVAELLVYQKRKKKFGIF